MTATITIDADEMQTLANFGYIDADVFNNNDVQTEDITNAIHGLIAGLEWRGK